VFTYKTKAAAAVALAATAALTFAGAADAGVVKPNVANPGDVQLISTDGTASLVHTIRHADGSWQQFGRLGGYTGVTGLTSTLVNGEENAFFQYAGANGPQLAHFVRHVDGSWDLNGSVPAVPAGTEADGLATANKNGQIELVKLTGGNVQLTTLRSDGTWSPWSTVPTGGKSVRSVAAASDFNGELRVVELAADGSSVGAYQQYTDGSWSDGTWANATPQPGYTATEVAAAYTFGALQIGVAEHNQYYGTVYHALLRDNGSWDRFWDVQQVAGFGGEVLHLAMTYSEGSMQLAFSTTDGALYHTIRYSGDGSWQPVGNVEGAAGNVNAGQLTLAGYNF